MNGQGEQSEISNAEIQKLLLQVLKQQAEILASREVSGINEHVGRDTVSDANNASKVMAHLSSRMPTFSYCPDSGQTFSKWFERHGTVIVEDGKFLDECSRVRLLIEKLDSDTYEKYKRHILPKEPASESFDDTVKVLKELFDVRVSLFTRRYQCLNIEKSDLEDYRDYTGRVNEMCENAQLSELTYDDLKSLMWIFGLKSSRDTEVRTLLLKFLDESKLKRPDQPVKLHDLYVECERIVALKQNSKMIEGPRSASEVNAHQKHEDTKTRRAQNVECYNCGKANHKAQQCKFRKAKCGKCQGFGHIQKYCDELRVFRNRNQSRSRKRSVRS